MDSATKLHCKVKYPLMEKALLTWVHANEESVDMTGDLIREKARNFISRALSIEEAFSF